MQLALCKNIDKLSGNDVAPPLVLNKEYPLRKTHTCKCKEVHFDIGLKSKYNYVSCYKCGENLPESDVTKYNDNAIHWAHSSRFQIKDL